MFISSQVTVKFVDIDSVTKEKTVKVIPNAIQFILKDKTKMTFTSFTARDRAYIMTFRLWQNALLDKVFKYFNATYSQDTKNWCSSKFMNPIFGKSNIDSTTIFNTY